MKVVMVHGRYRSAAPSGENHVVDQETALLRAAGHEVLPFERRSDDISGWSLPAKAALPARTVWNRGVRADLRALLDAERPDVVHVHNTFPLLTPSVLHACRDAGVPVVATLHNYKLVCASGDFFRDGRPCHDCSGTHGGPALRHGCYRGSRLATAPVVAGTDLNRSGWRHLVAAYVFISASQRELMRSLDLPADRVFVKHNFVPEIAAADAPERDHAVAYVGRLDEAKGVPFLIRAWDAFRASHPGSPLRLVVAGGGPLDETVRTWAARHPSVDVVGLVPREEAARLIRRSLAVVVPSQWEETFGLVAIEAMAAGVAPLAPDRGSFPELVHDGVDGALYPAEDAEALAVVLSEVDRDPDRFIACGRRARAGYEQETNGHRPAANLEQLLAIYRFAVAHPVGGAARVG